MPADSPKESKAEDNLREREVDSFSPHEPTRRRSIVSGHHQFENITSLAGDRERGKSGMDLTTDEYLRSSTAGAMLL